MLSNIFFNYNFRKKNQRNFLEELKFQKKNTYQEMPLTSSQEKGKNKKNEG